MNAILGMTVAVALMFGGLWANVGDGGALTHSRGAWVSSR
jgi:hypothetical protein